MMDPSNPSPADGLEAVHQNGVHDEHSNSGKDSVVSNIDPSVAEISETVTSNGNIENDVLLDNTATINLSVAEIKEETNDSAGSNNVIISKEEDVKITDQSEQLRASKDPVKNKKVKSPSPKGVHASGAKKSKDGRDEEAQSAVPNGSLALNARQPIKSRSFNDRKPQISKHSEKSDAASSGASTENTKPKSLKKGTLDKFEEEAQSSSSVTAGDTKTRKVGTLPNYGFSFKCDERAERRKEFYSKLEEKIHAKEVEKSNLQAKTKETQEAEIKMLRKSLAFKATPMPSFYQEPPPPKVELKKIPTTRAKSPKLGRRKNSTDSESDGNPSGSARQGRISLDEKVSQSIPAKGVTHVHQKKPQRRSLPSRLPSERTSSSNSTTAATSSKAQNDEKTALSSVTNKDTTLSNARGKEESQMDAHYEENGILSYNASEAPVLMEEQNAVTLDKPIETEPHVNGDIVVEEQPQIPLVQEPIAAEH